MKKWMMFPALLFSWIQLGCQNQVFSLPPEQKQYAQSITYNNKVDVVWIIDDSSSMNFYQNKLKDQVPVLLQSFLDKKLDFRMTVVSTSMTGSLRTGGQFLGGIFTPTTVNLVDGLKQQLILGQNGSDFEQGLDSLSAALHRDTSGVFLRPDALLAVVTLSDEDDKSQISVDSLVTYLDQLKPRWVDGSRSWIFNFIGQIDDHCKDILGNYEIGLRFQQLSSASGGVAARICDNNYSEAISNINKRVLSFLTDYHLDRTPDPSSIKVLINDQSVPEDKTHGWEYIATGDLVRFHGAWIPKADDRISVDFQPIHPK